MMKPILHQAIRIQFKPSELMLGLLSLISIVCCWILLALAIAPMIKFVGILVVIASSIYFILRDALLMLPWSWQVLELDTKGQLTLIDKRGEKFRPALAESTFIHTKLMILNFKRAGANFALAPVIFLFRQTNTDELRRLRVWLRWAKHNQKPNQEDLVVAND
jgi:hypothetical protein